jgi:hypothetical protein
MATSFYLILPSNSSLDYFPDNSLANYKTKLPQYFDLSGEWEVGLSEIQFPISWYNVSEKESHVYIRSMGIRKAPDIWHDVSPPGGNYDTPEQLVAQINENIQPLLRDIYFVYNSISKKISIKSPPNLFYTSFKITTTMADILGFDWRRHIEIEGDDLYQDEPNFIEINPQVEKYTADLVCDLRRGFYSLFVYCDLCEPVVVGNYKVPLLKTISLQGADGELVNRIYHPIQYVSLQRKQFDTIEVNIKTDAGQTVPFQRGKLLVTLHLRQKKPSYF